MLKVEKITKSFLADDRKTQVLKDISFEVGEGEFLCLVGPSGCGKSTLLRILAGLDKPDSGSVTFIGKPKISFVFQHFAIFPWLTVWENVAFPLKMQGERGVGEKVTQLLKEVGLGSFGDKHPKELSGGMKQRVGIARALSIDPDILFMDEPLSTLDALTADVLRAEILRIWAERKMTVIAVTHLLDEAVEFADRVLVLTPRPGQIEAEVKIDLPRPRSKKMPQFFALTDKLRAKIHLDMLQ